jgi:hypothetical protein
LRDTFSRELPHSVKAEIAWPGLIAGVVMLIWAWWFDRVYCDRRPGVMLFAAGEANAPKAGYCEVGLAK